MQWFLDIFFVLHLVLQEGERRLRSIRVKNQLKYVISFLCLYIWEKLFCFVLNRLSLKRLLFNHFGSIVLHGTILTLLDYPIRIANVICVCSKSLFLFILPLWFYLFLFFLLTISLPNNQTGLSRRGLKERKEQMFLLSIFSFPMQLLFFR